MKIPFNEIFTQNPDDSLTPLRTIRIEGAMLGPGVSFRRGVVISGVDIFEALGCDLEVEEGLDGVSELKGYYKKANTNVNTCA